MTNAIRIHERGGPEVLTWEPVEVGAPGPGEALIAQTAVGLNFIDVYHRTGLYPVPAMPAIIGSEAAGVVEAVGDGVYGSGPRRPGRLLHERRQLHRAAADPGARPGPHSRRRQRPAGCGHDAERLHGALPAAADLRSTARRHHPVSRRGGRLRADRLPVGEAPGRHGHRHRQHARQGRAGQERTAATTSSSTRRRTSPSGCGS